ncbi:MAG: TIGR03915 family putative DNA repair protein [Treponema sp.]|jgi:probable DNA metabolism protein|nr:TIGR03915 family putative DNA repair protein [Treponema sp.]
MSQGELFGGEGSVEDRNRFAGNNLSRPDRILERLEEISPDACNDAIHALLSEQSPAAAVRRFVEKVIGAAEAAGMETENGRMAAEKARTDILDPDTEKVQAAAYKTVREFDRLRGLLRFKPEDGGRYTARCSPDHFVLPLLADHFTARFGGVPWAVIDEKRRLILRGGGKDRTEIVAGTITETGESRRETSVDLGGLDAWETLWRTFHHAANNEDRNNPALQKQFIPERYRKYLTEFF